MSFEQKPHTEPKFVSFLIKRSLSLAIGIGEFVAESCFDWMTVGGGDLYFIISMSYSLSLVQIFLFDAKWS
jgi:hypothetical protein